MSIGKNNIFILVLIALSLAGCGVINETKYDAIEIKHTDDEYDVNEEIEVWTLADDLSVFAEKYEEETGVKVHVTKYDSEEYEEVINNYFNDARYSEYNNGPDVFVAEPQMLDVFYDNGYFTNLDNFGISDYEDKQIDYVWKLGIDEKGIHRTVSYQVTPAGIYFRADIAKEVFGTDNPDEVGALFRDYSTICETAERLKEAGYLLFASSRELEYFLDFSNWINRNDFNVEVNQFEYIDTITQLKQSGCILDYEPFSDYWYQGMEKAIPIIPDDILNDMENNSENLGDIETDEYISGCEAKEVFAYGLPTWGVIIMRDALESDEHVWKVCSGPSEGYGGGSFLGISDKSTKKDTAYDFIRFCTLDEDVAEWWITVSNHDVTALKSVLNNHIDDDVDILGNEKMYRFWKNESDKMGISNISRYSSYLTKLVRDTVSKISSGELSRQEASLFFYGSIKRKYPEFNIDYTDDGLWADFSSVSVGSQLLKNPSFENGMNNWTELITNWGDIRVVDAVSSVGNGGILYCINNPGTEEWNIQLKQSNIELERGCTYRVSFVVNSTEARKIKTGVMNSRGEAWFGGKSVSLSAGTDVKVSYDIKMDYDSKVDFFISLGKMDDDTPSSNISIWGLSITRIS